MYCVFSKALLKRYAQLHGMIPAVNDYTYIKPSKLLQEKVNATGYAFVYNRLNPDAAYNYLLGPLSSYAVNNVVQWAEKNITSQLKKMSIKTYSVKLRIMVGMFNNLVLQNKIDKDISIELVNNFTANIRDLQHDISIEDLPF